MGTPVDPTPRVVSRALASAADSPGYPSTAGTPELRAAAVDWLERRFKIRDLDPESVLPTIGSKELVAGLPLLLGIGPGDVVAIPELAYPTYEVGARLVGADVVRTDVPLPDGATHPKLLWLNSPANPTGRVLGVDELSELVGWARDVGAVVASDECYIECGWDAEPTSVLHSAVSGGSMASLLGVFSLSKRSNLAGYRAGFVAGDSDLVAELLAVRRNLGMMVPGPVQVAATAALVDDDHVEEQYVRYLDRRTKLRGALKHAGFRVDHSEGSLYLWVTRHESCWDTVGWFAARGILVAPGDFYGPGGSRHVRLALTATDERIDAAVSRLTA